MVRVLQASLGVGRHLAKGTYGEHRDTELSLELLELPCLQSMASKVLNMISKEVLATLTSPSTNQSSDYGQHRSTRIRSLTRKGGRSHTAEMVIEKPLVWRSMASWNMGFVVELCVVVVLRMLRVHMSTSWAEMGRSKRYQRLHPPAP
ncbi:hypothetical protein BHM03_00038868 [Ensete ventricosum]|nr:hypothetical protein BHM03_00038868 [Ensete ventricosum]